MPKKKKRQFDIVLFGATGFTGKLVAEYLSKNDSVSVALAGRNLKKLESVRDAIPAAKNWELLEADVFDQESLNALAAQTKVICTTVGPYATFGVGVVKACVENGTDYCDLTGETHFIREIIDAYHDEAVANGTKIVTCCGFDSVPSDLGVHLLQNYSAEKYETACDVVNMYVTRASGGFSGGTVASMSNIMKEAADNRDLRRLLKDPFALNPVDSRPDLKQYDQMGPAFANDINRWTAPFVMASINTRIVRRSNALLGHPYTEKFQYSESMTTGSGVKGRAKAVAISGALGAFVGALSVSPVRGVLEKRVLPKSGEGPSKEKQETGSFRIEFIGHIDGKPKVKTIVEGYKDPGYAGTAIMLGESAVCLAVDKLPDVSGVLTPATAMGDMLVDRLRSAGMRLETLAF